MITGPYLAHVIWPAHAQVQIIWLPEGLSEVMATAHANATCDGDGRVAWARPVPQPWADQLIQTRQAVQESADAAVTAHVAHRAAVAARAQVIQRCLDEINYLGPVCNNPEPPDTMSVKATGDSPLR